MHKLIEKWKSVTDKYPTKCSVVDFTIVLEEQFRYYYSVRDGLDEFTLDMYRMLMPMIPNILNDINLVAIVDVEHEREFITDIDIDYVADMFRIEPHILDHLVVHFQCAILDYYIKYDTIVFGKGPIIMASVENNKFKLYAKKPIALYEIQ